MAWWAGRFFVCEYCIQPKAIPIRQMMRPTFKIVNPPSDPPMKLTWLRSGSLMSASPAKAMGVIRNRMMTSANNREPKLRFPMCMIQSSSFDFIFTFA